MLILTEANTLKPTSFAGIGWLKDVTSVWKGKTAADSQWDQHVSRTFSILWKIADSRFISLIVLVTEGFCFFPHCAETSFNKQAFHCRRLLMSRATTFMFILNWRPACTPSGASCQNNALMDRWLGSCCLMTMNILDTCDICLLMPHYVAGKYPKYLAWSPTRLPLEKLTS